MVMLVSYEIQAIKNKFFFSLIPTHPVLMYLHFSEQKLVLHFFLLNVACREELPNLMVSLPKDKGNLEFVILRQRTTLDMLKCYFINL